MFSTEPEILLILICLLLSGLFSGLEIAYISRDKLNFEIKSNSPSLLGKVYRIINKKTSEVIATLLIGNNLSLVVYGILMAQFIEPILVEILPSFLNDEIYVLSLQTIISTLIVLVTAEYIPKSIFLINADKLLVTFSVPLIVIYFVFYPLVYIIIRISRFFIEKILNQNYYDNRPVFKLTDLNEYIKKIVVSDSKKEPNKVTEFFKNALNLKSVKVRDFMIPRTEIIGIDVNESIAELKKIIENSGHTKIIVFDSSIDKIIGYCHGLSLFKNPKKIKDITRPISFVNETNQANDLLFSFISNQINIAIVIDEFGGTSGLISLEDIIEEIFGEIIDEFDEKKFLEDKVDSNSYNFSARLEIDYLNNKYGLNIPNGEYDTLGGFILSFNKNIPKINEVLSHGNFSIKVLSKTNNRIDIVFFRKNVNI